jgi:hypothetical protein
LENETKQKDLPRSSNETDVPPNGLNGQITVAFLDETRKHLQADEIQTRDRDPGSCVEHGFPKELNDHEELASPLEPLLDGFPRSAAAVAVAVVVAALDIVGYVAMSEDPVHEALLLRLGVPHWTHVLSC